LLLRISDSTECIPPVFPDLSPARVDALFAWRTPVRPVFRHFSVMAGGK
jgi:hypothetical protein